MMEHVSRGTSCDEGLMELARLVVCRILHEVAPEYNGIDALTERLASEPKLADTWRDAQEYKRHGIDHWRKVCARLTRERDALREALTPFRDAFMRRQPPSPQARKDWFEKMPDRFTIELFVTMGDGRKAVSTLDAGGEHD